MAFLAVSEEQKANAKPLEPAIEALLRTVDLDGELITILRVRNVLDREIFSSLEMNEEKFRETIASVCGIDNTNFEHKLETAKLVKAWRTSSLQAEVKSKVDAVRKAQEEPIQMLSEDSACLMRQLNENLDATFMHRDFLHNVNFDTSRANPSCEELVHAQFHPSSSSEQFPPRSRCNVTHICTHRTTHFARFQHVHNNSTVSQGSQEGLARSTSDPHWTCHMCQLAGHFSRGFGCFREINTFVWIGQE